MIEFGPPLLSACCDCVDCDDFNFFCLLTARMEICVYVAMSTMQPIKPTNAKIHARIFGEIFESSLIVHKSKANIHIKHRVANTFFLVT